LNLGDLEEMTVGMCFDYAEEYVVMHDPKRRKKTARRATQADFDAF